MTVNLDFKVTTVIFRPIDALNVSCAQLTRDLFAIAKFLLLGEYTAAEYRIAKTRYTYTVCLSATLYKYCT